MVPIEIMVAEARKPMTDSVAAPQAFNRTVREDRPEVSPWNLPNLLTMIRLVLAFFLCAAIAWEWWLTGLVIMLFASITDWLDGYLARLQGLVSSLGRMLDPLVDKVLISGVFIFLLPVAAAHGETWLPRQTMCMYGSSLNSATSVPSSMAPNPSRSSRVATPPVGLCGELRKIPRARG